MNLISISIRRPVLTLVIVILFVLLGLSGMRGMGISLLPKIEVPFVSVRTSYTGAGPEDMETLVSKPLEDAISQVQGVRRLESTSLEGISFVFIEFDPDIGGVSSGSMMMKAASAWGCFGGTSRFTWRKTPPRGSFSTKLRSR